MSEPTVLFDRLPAAGPSGTMGTFTRPGFDRGLSSVVDSIAPFGPGRVNNDLGSRRGFAMRERCIAEGCEKERQGREWCGAHYMDAKRRGLFIPKPPPAATLEDRYWAFVVKRPDGCWEWTGPTHKGYGRVKFARVQYMATHISLALAGRPLAAGEFALHHCDNPPCTRPDHLFAGSKEENAGDRHLKNRDARGRLVNTNVLSEQDVHEIRRLYASGGYSQPQLGALFGVRHSTIGYIVRRETWAWLEDETC